MIKNSHKDTRDDQGDTITQGQITHHREDQLRNIQAIQIPRALGTAKIIRINQIIDNNHHQHQKRLPLIPNRLTNVMNVGIRDTTEVIVLNYAVQW